MQYAEQPANHDKDKPQQECEKEICATVPHRHGHGHKSHSHRSYKAQQPDRKRRKIFGQENARGQGQHHAQKGRAPH
jgi:hypothetical protein